MKPFLFLVLFFSVKSFAAGDVEVKVLRMKNVAKNTVIEACGTAKHSGGTKPLLVTLKHDSSTYTTLTSATDDWCILFRRVTWSGDIEVGASTLQDMGTEIFERFDLK